MIRTPIVDLELGSSMLIACPIIPSKILSLSAAAAQIAVIILQKFVWQMIENRLHVGNDVWFNLFVHL